MVWIHARRHAPEFGWLALIDAYETSDRRDADVMFHIELSKIGTESDPRKAAHSILSATIFVGGDAGVAFTERPW